MDVLVIPFDSPEQEHSLLDFRKKNNQRTARIVPKPKVGIRLEIRELQELFGTLSVPETIDGKQQMIV